MARQKIKRLCILFVMGIAMAGIVIAAYHLLRYYGIDYICPIKHLLHFSCAGCGNTRAIVAFCRLEFAEGIEYNYLFPLEAFYILYVIIVSSKVYIDTGKYEYGNKYIIIDILMMTFIVAWTVARNILGI